MYPDSIKGGNFNDAKSYKMSAFIFVVLLRLLLIYIQKYRPNFLNYRARFILLNALHSELR